MATLRGPHTINDLVLPPGIDGGMMAQFRLKDGTNMQRFMNETQAAVNGVNQEMLSWNFLYSTQVEPEVIYIDGGVSGELQEITDMTLPDMVRGEISGHMLPNRTYGGKLGGSYLFWQDADLTEQRLTATINSFTYQISNTFEKKLLERLFATTEEAIGSGHSVPFVQGGTGAVDWSPPPFGGHLFDTTHDHYLSQTGQTASNRAALINAMVKTFAHHGPRAPYQLLVADADVEKYLELANTASLVDIPGLIGGSDQGGGTNPRFVAAGTPNFGPTAPFAYFQSARGRVDLLSYPRVPSNYMCLFKRDSANSARNPLRLRLHQSSSGFGARLIPSTTNNTAYPLSTLDILFRFGFGVTNNRVAAVLGQLNASAYATPVIT